ncbi:MAG: hypothetical protein HOH43_21210 [Candidatus Latescibacteria bacterium]|nr:hypothetical protein [Candidatus Latescibacterota bacterium]
MSEFRLRQAGQLEEIAGHGSETALGSILIYGRGVLESRSAEPVGMEHALNFALGLE